MTLIQWYNNACLHASSTHSHFYLFANWSFSLWTSFKELENAVEGWTDDLAHLSLLKETLSVYISADDLSILSERIELLHRQWEELCHQASRVLSPGRSMQARKVLGEKLNASGSFWKRCI